MKRYTASMPKGIALPFIIVAAVVVGGLLYLYGGDSFRAGLAPQTGTESVSSSTHFKVLAKGDNAQSIDTRVNYRVVNAEQFKSLWDLVYSTSGPTIPDVDFSKYEVLASFDGSHSTHGYGITITDVRDIDGKKVTVIEHLQPGESCSPGEAPSSPFMMVLVPKSPLQLDHQDTDVTTHCE